jgi:hypothetical protein
LIQELPQQQADVLMKSLDGGYLQNWKTAFPEERDSPRTGPIALPPDKRTYYLVESYLIGVSECVPELVDI